MQIRCSYCQTMFATTRDADLEALRERSTTGLHHYDAHCPKCRKANHIGMDRLERTYPAWKQLLASAAKAPKSAEPAKEEAEKAAPAKPAAKKTTAKKTK
jgi:hypothetical protein